jgi:PAS domain S-box-containing protein
LVTPTGEIVDEWATENLSRITGYTFAELPKGENGWQQLVDPNDRPAVHQFLQSVIANNRSGVLEYRIITQQGETRWICDRVQPIWDETANRVVQLLGATEDITNRKQSEAKIREQAALIDISPDAILVRDLDCRVLFWNHGAEQMYGWSAAEVLGQSSCDLLFKQRPPRLESALKTVREQGEWHGELEKVTKSGEQITVDSRWILRRDQQGEPQSILTVDTNITEQKQLEAQFLRAQRLESLGTLASGISHDMNNVLTPILTSAQLLLLKLPDVDEKSQKLLQLIHTNSRRAADLVKQILSFARGMEGKRTVMQVMHLLLELKQMIESTFPKSIDMTFITPRKSLRPVLADATQLHQVVMNLCVNARDAMPDGGKLNIKAEDVWIDQSFAQMHLDAQIGPYVLITVSDTGMGMSPAVKERIFDPFFTTKEVGKGTGLGLSTVLGIVKSHGGFIDVISEAGSGSQFKVYLPAIEAVSLPVVSESDLLRGQGELILVVDDEEPIRQTTQTVLETYNYRVLTAQNGIDAIAQFAEHHAHLRLVLMDLMMPEMDGLTAIGAIQSINAHSQIIATSGAGEPDQQRLEQLGVISFLPKPYTASELLRTVHQGLAINKMS